MQTMTKGYRLRTRVRITEMCTTWDARRGLEIACMRFVDPRTKREYSWVGEAVDKAVQHVPCTFGDIVEIDAWVYGGRRLRRGKMSKGAYSFRGLAWHKRHPEVRPVCW